MNFNKFNNKTIVVLYSIVAVLAVVGVIVFSWNLSTNHTDQTPNVEDMSETQLDRLLMDAGFDMDEINSMSVDDKRIAASNTERYRYERSAKKLYSSAAGAVEYPQPEALYQKYLELFEIGQYDAIINDLEQMLLTYNFSSGKNLNVVALFSDAYVMSNYDYMEWEDKETALKSLSNPESFVMSVLYASPRRREAVVYDLNSLSPVSMGSVKIISSTQLSQDSSEYKANADFRNDLRNVYRVDFSFGEYDALYAYVLESHDRVLRLAGIYSDKEYEIMRTVAWWIALGIDRERGE